MRGLLGFFTVLLTICDARAPWKVSEITGDQLIEYLNTKQSLFRAAKSKFTPSQMERRVMKSNYRPSVPTREKDPIHVLDTIPESFDARDKWSNCASIGSIQDQSDCGSCWAVSTSEIMSDRWCIASGGQQKLSLSAEDILTCCKECGGGCDGGFPDKALDWWTKTGVVTGGNFINKAGCRPYEISPCGNHTGEPYYGPCPYESPQTPECKLSCQSGYAVPYAQDKHFGSSSYEIWTRDQVAGIQQEIMINGPVATIFDVYEDFYNYESGIYKYTAGRYVGGHVVKFVGWGVDNGTPYWLVANSWASDWGENGFFRIIRGQNEVNIETWVYAGQPNFGLRNN